MVPSGVMGLLTAGLLPAAGRWQDALHRARGADRLGRVVPEARGHMRWQPGKPPAPPVRLQQVMATRRPLCGAREGWDNALNSKRQGHATERRGAPVQCSSTRRRAARQAGASPSATLLTTTRGIRSRVPGRGQQQCTSAAATFCTGWHEQAVCHLGNVGWRAVEPTFSMHPVRAPACG